MSTLSRGEYEALQRQEWMESAKMAGGWTEEQAQYYMDGQYPISTEKAIQELQERGLDATPWRLQRLCRFPELRPQEIVFLWDKATIDRVAAALEENGALTVRARYRREMGLTFAQELELIELAKAKREVDHAERA